MSPTWNTNCPSFGKDKPLEDNLEQNCYIFEKNILPKKALKIVFVGPEEAG